MKQYRMIVYATYKYDDLTEEQKERVIDKWLETGMMDDWWYENVYEDAEQAGLKITGFDIDRGNYCTGKFIDNAVDCAEAIIKNHGEQCETYKTAKTFLDTVIPMIEVRDNFADNDDTTQEEYDKQQENADTIEELEEEFLKSILEDYRIILQHEYEYQTSQEYIEETIRANDYDFDDNGNIV